mmetsp:Transcript_9646/g.17340  ORF Transcript_9646/g.17340 Transcript_9646/m.17340 type:complete len:540 (+) Transcript_9646:22-1641(+)
MPTEVPLTRAALKEELREELKTQLQDFRNELLAELSKRALERPAGQPIKQQEPQAQAETSRDVLLKEGSGLKDGQISSRALHLDGDDDLVEESASGVEWLQIFIKGDIFAYGISLLLICNAVLIGVQANWVAQHGGYGHMPGIDVLNGIFFCVFLCELILRMVAFGLRDFFMGEDYVTNIFDFFLVTAQAGEIAGEAMSGDSVDTGFLRLLRVLRIVRIVRLARVVHLVVHLRSMISSVFASLKPLFWAVVLFGMVIYCVAVAMMETVNEYKNRHRDEHHPGLDAYFGDLLTTFISLWQCISGGIDWSEMAGPLGAHIGKWLEACFCFYVAFSMLAMMNVITGIFVENAQIYSQQDKDAYVVKHVLDLFQKADVGDDGEITWEIFREKLNTRELQELFAAVDVDVTDAESLFRLIDQDSKGSITADDLMTGWMRLRGPAKALDQSLLIREVSRISDLTSRQTQELVSALNSTRKMMSQSDKAQEALTEIQVVDDGDIGSIRLKRATMKTGAAARKSMRQSIKASNEYTALQQPLRSPAP